jgi:hypothetical protein
VSAGITLVSPVPTALIRFALPLEPRLLDLEARHAAAFLQHPPGRGEEAEGQARAGARLRLGRWPSAGGARRGSWPRLRDAAGCGDLLAVEVAVEGVLDVLELAVVVRFLEGPRRATAITASQSVKWTQ